MMRYHPNERRTIVHGEYGKKNPSLADAVETQLMVMPLVISRMLSVTSVAWHRFG